MFRRLSYLNSTVACLVILFLASAAGPIGCEAKKAEKKLTEPESKAVASPETKTPDTPDKKTAEETPPAEAKEPARRASAAQILVSFDKSKWQIPNVTRTKEQALIRAKEARAFATKPGVTFGDAVKKYSDVPGAEQNDGVMGIFARELISPNFQSLVDALFKVKVGEITEIVETDRGYHILKRIPVEEFAAVHIWIHYKGHPGAKTAVTRTKEEARERAEMVLALAKQPDTQFEDLLEEYSDESEGRNLMGGFMGIFNRGQLIKGPAASLKVLFDLKVGEMHEEVVESGYGFHILKRAPIERYKIGVRQIVIQFKDCKAVRPEVTRTKDEARKLADTIAAEAKKEGADFAALARKHTNHPSAKKGGDIGQVVRGQNIEGFDEVAFALKVGEMSEVFETVWGFYIVKRYE